MKKDFIMAINYAKYLAFVLATVCVLVCQFTGNMLWVTMALSLYVVAFGMMFASSVFHAQEVFQADRTIKRKHLTETYLEADNNGDMIVNVPSELKGEEVEKVSLKHEKVWSVIGSIFFGVFALFTFVVLVLY